MSDTLSECLKQPGFMAAATLHSVYSHIRREGSSVGQEREFYPFGEATEPMGFERV